MPVAIASKTASVGGSLLTSSVQTTSTTFVSAVSLSVPNNNFYAVAIGARETSGSGQGEVQVKEGATVVWGPVGVSAGPSTTYYYTFQKRNTSGSAQTVDAQYRSVTGSTVRIQPGTGIVHSSLWAAAGKQAVNTSIPMRGTVDTLRARYASAYNGFTCSVYGLSSDGALDQEFATAPGMVVSSVPVIATIPSGSGAWAVAFDFDGYTIRVTT